VNFLFYCSPLEAYAPFVREKNIPIPKGTLLVGFCMISINKKVMWWPIGNLGHGGFNRYYKISIGMDKQE